MTLPENTGISALLASWHFFGLLAQSAMAYPEQVHWEKPFAD